jgi:hypothetical protein
MRARPLFCVTAKLGGTISLNRIDAAVISGNIGIGAVNITIGSGISNIVCTGNIHLTVRDQEMLAALDKARNFTHGADAGDTPWHLALKRLRTAIEDVGTMMTGDREYFHAKAHKNTLKDFVPHDSADWARREAAEWLIDLDLSRWKNCL